MGEHESTDTVSESDADYYALLLEAAECGDALAAYCLSVGHSVSPDPDETEPNTIRQAYARPDRHQWREAVETEWEMVQKFMCYRSLCYYRLKLKHSTVDGYSSEKETILEMW